MNIPSQYIVPIILAVCIVVVSIILRSYGGGQQTGNRYFDENKATDFVFAKMKNEFPDISKTTIGEIIDAEWEWQTEHASKENGALQLVERSDPQLIAYLTKKFPQTSENYYKKLFTYLEMYEDRIK